MYEKTLKNTRVVNEDHFSSLMEPFAFRRNEIEHGTVILQWLNLVVADEWGGQGKYILFIEFVLKLFKNSVEYT